MTSRSALRVVSVLSTGGTISSRSDPIRGRQPADRGADLVKALPDPSAGAAVNLRVIDVLRTSSFALGPTDLWTILRAVNEQLNDPQVTGVVVTHGTDTLEETAYFLHLFHHDPRPVVLTGAMRPADHPAPDGPGNLRDAICVAAAADSRHRGVLVSFAGQVFAAATTRKVSTSALTAFAAPDFGTIARIGPRDNSPLFAGGTPQWLGNGLARPALPSPPMARVDIVAVYPGADTTAMHSLAAAGATGVVLEGTGSGNTPPSFTAAVAALTAAGVIVALSSRVHSGAVLPLYGGPGGGRELVDAGAISAGWLPSSQTRIALMALSTQDADLTRARALLNQLGAEPQRSGNITV